MIEFDPEKDIANQAKHSISLAMAVEMIVEALVPDPHPIEARMRAFGVIRGQRFCLIYTMRAGRMRAISLRRVHRKEYERYVRQA